MVIGRSCRTLDQKEKLRDGDGSYLQASAPSVFCFLLVPPRLGFSGRGAPSRSSSHFCCPPPAAPWFEDCLLYVCLLFSSRRVSFVCCFLFCAAVVLCACRRLHFSSLFRAKIERVVARAVDSPLANAFLLSSMSFGHSEPCRAVRSGYSCVIVAVQEENACTARRRCEIVIRCLAC